MMVILIAAFITVDRITLVEPEWPAKREGETILKRPAEDDPPFHRVPVAETFEERRQYYLKWALEQPQSEGRDRIWAQVLRMEAGQEFLCDDALQWSLHFVNERNDCADFVVGGLLRLYYKFAGTGRLTESQEEAIKEALLHFRYWLDEPNPTHAAMELYTENHQIMTHSSEYLAGQLFPDEIFTNVEQDGRWRKERARFKILNWIDWRSRTGMAEWDSTVYYPINLGGLLNLIDFAKDEEIAAAAAMMTDLLLFDIAVDSYYGLHGATTGRAESHNIKSAAGDSLVTVQALLWGLGRFQTTSNMGTVAIATSHRYRLPSVIESIALDMPEEMTNLERHSIHITDEDAEKYGLRFTGMEDAALWLAMAAIFHPEIFGNAVLMADEWDLWHIAGDDSQTLISLARLADRLGVIKFAGRLGVLPFFNNRIGLDVMGAYLTEVNKVTYRTPDYMLSTAQDYRKGEMGYQQHIWQASLGPYAVMFVNNPGSLRESGHRPGYWAGNSRLPRAVQHENLHISLFDIDRNKGLAESRHFAFTHAYFPRWAFDEVREIRVEPGGDGEGRGGWILGRKENGYVALYSHLPYRWQEEGPDAGQEVIALGRQNIWVALMGRKAVDGSFDQFANMVATIPIKVDGLKVELYIPAKGEVSFGWDDPLIVDGNKINLRNYPRWDNPYTFAEFNAGRFVISHGDKKLELDFEKGIRNIVN